MARYEFRVTHPNQVSIDRDDGTVTIYQGDDEVAVAFGNDRLASAFVIDVLHSRAAMHDAIEAAMGEFYEDQRCPECEVIVGHAPGCLHVDPIRQRVRDLNVATRSIIRDAYSVPQSRSAR